MVTDIWVFSDRALAVVDLTGFDVDASDGRVGRVKQSRGDVGREHLIVDAQPSLPGDRTMIIPAGLIGSVDTDGRRIRVDRSRNELRSAPSYDHARGVDTSYRSDVNSYFAPSREQTRSEGRSGSRSTSRSQRPTGSQAQQPSRSRSSRRAQRDEPTKAELYEQAKRLGIEGRSKMSKAQLARAVERGQGRRTESTGRGSKQKAHPVDVQSFLEGVRYPTKKGDLLRQARREGASDDVRSTIQRLPDKEFKDPTDVSQAIGSL